MRQCDFPEWALKIKEQHKGTQLRKIGNNIYLYAVHSRRVPGKTYPVTSQEYIGLVTESGLVEAQGFQFKPLSSVASKLSNVVSLDCYPDSDEQILSDIVLVKNGETWYYPKLTEEQEKVLRKHKLLSNHGGLGE